MWHQGFNRNFTKILFVCNSSPQVTVFRNFGDYPTTYSALFAFSRQRAHAECKQRWLCWFNFWDTLQNGGRRWIGEKNCWINRVIIVFFAYKKYSRSFVKLRLNVTWTSLLMSLLCFCVLIVVVSFLSMDGQRALRFHQKYLNLCSEDERWSYRFGKSWGWVINDRIVIWGGTIPLIYIEH